MQKPRRANKRRNVQVAKGKPSHWRPDLDAFDPRCKRGKTGSGLPVAPNPTFPCWLLLVFVQVLYVTMVYGPIAAYLVEAYPAKIRYSSVIVALYNRPGVLGGLVPLVGIICVRPPAISMPVCGIDECGRRDVCGRVHLLKETHGHKIWDSEAAAMK